jgi:hypothetical protein
MERFIFTFGSGQPLAGRAQPIHASSWDRAREIMVRVYGLKWGFQYDEEQWHKMETDKNRFWTMEALLPPIYDEEDQS